MTRKCKTPPLVLELLNRQQAQMKHITGILHTKRTVKPENQADWVRERSEEYYIGRADGINALIEDALHEARCYAGYHYQAATPTIVGEESYIASVSTSHPEFAEWRRCYFTRA